MGESATSGVNRAIPRYFLQIGILTLVYAVTLFVPAGRLDWRMAWIFVAIVAASQIGVALILMVNNPALLGERAESKGPRDLDRVLAGIMALFGPASTCLVAGLNLRLGWLPQMPSALEFAGIALAVLGSLVTAWAMASNKFFYGVLRIAQEKNHLVCASGPYQYVRHPGYLGAILFDLGTPLMLGSAWALIPAAFTVCAIVVRTRLEDETLQNELAGYRDYARRVRQRLLPGIW